MREIPFELKILEIENPEELNFILGQSHFIKTVEDLYEALVQSSPALKFGIAFNEASPGYEAMPGEAAAALNPCAPCSVV